MPVVNKPVLQDIGADSMLFSLDVAEQCARHEKITKFLKNGSNAMEGDGLNKSLISDLMGFKAVDVPSDNELSTIHETELEDMQKVIYPQNKIYLPQPLLDFVENLSNNSLITVQLDGRVLFTDGRSEFEMRNLFSIFQEFGLSSNMSNGSRKAMVVPYFTRKRGGHAKVNNQTSTMNPSKSAEKTKTKPQQRNKQVKSTSKERREKTHLYWCDCLLNLYVDKTANKAAINDVKETSSEIIQVVSRTSAVTVAIGFVVIFNIALKTVYNGAVLFSPANVFTACFGMGFFWLSSAMNKLTYSVYGLSRMSSSRVKKKPDEERMIVEKIKKSVNDVMFRFAVLAMVGLLKF